MTFVPLLDRARLGAPVSSKALTMVPIHLDGEQPSVDYLPLGQAIARGRAQLTEISEGGSVPLLAVKNDSDFALFILDGEELLGAKQNRVVNLSILVPPRSILPIPVSCVEHGRWSFRTRSFDVSPNTLFAAGRADQMAAVTMCLKQHGQRHGDQAGVWGAVDERAAACGTRSPTSAMKDIYDDREAAIAELLAGLTPQPRQAGAVFALGGRVVGMELFETPEMFLTYFNKIARGYALDATVEPEHAAFEPGDADELLRALRRASAERFKAVGLGEDIRIDDAAVQGGALVLDDRLVHLAAFRRTTMPTQETAHFGVTTELKPPSLRRHWTFWARVKHWMGG
ncbi:MAG: DUF6569 family protein [Gemmatimonadaceae bacterium]